MLLWIAYALHDLQHRPFTRHRSALTLPHARKVSEANVTEQVPHYLAAFVFRAP